MRARSLAAIFGVLALLLFRAPALAAEASWREQLNHAENLFRASKSEEAAEAAADALVDAEKTLGPGAHELGHILARLSEFCRASGLSSRLPKIEKRLRDVKPKDFEVWFALGTLLREEGRSAEADDALKNALELKPHDAAAEYERALVSDDMGLFQGKEEVRLLKEMIEKNPHDYSRYSELARAYTRLGRSSDAKATYVKAKKAGGMAADAYIDEGYFYLHSKEPAHAERAFRNAIAVDTASPFGYHHMGSYLSDRGRYPEAEKYFRQALEKLDADPKPSLKDRLHTLEWLGKVIQEQGRYAEAEVIYLEALKLAPPGGDRQLDMLGSLAKLYVSEGRIAMAEEAYKRAASSCRAGITCGFSYAGTALIDLGRFYLSQGRRAEAEATAERVEKFSAGVPIGQGRFSILRELSYLYKSLGNVSRDATIYNGLLPMRRAMPFDPDLIWVERGLAEMDTARGRFPEAEDHFRLEIGILDHNGYWKEEAGVLDALVAVYESDGKRKAMAAARAQATALRARP